MAPGHLSFVQNMPKEPPVENVFSKMENTTSLNICKHDLFMYVLEFRKDHFPLLVIFEIIKSL